MSLRTKLLAAVVGLNGVILLLALYLLLRSESGAAAPPSRELVLNLPAVGAALMSSDDPRERRHALQAVEVLEASGVVRDLMVVEERPAAGEGADGRRVRSVWRALEYLRPGGPQDEIGPGDARRETEEAFRRANRQPHNHWAGEDRVAIVLPIRLPDGGRRGLVASYVVPQSRHRGLKMVYVTMVIGVIVLTAVSFLLVSRLVIRPLASISEAADRIASGDYRIQVPQRGTNDEFDRTTSAFNRMAREIAEYQSHLEDRVLSALNRMKKAEQHLAIAQRLAATGKLASGVAHEINNPLGGTKNALRALTRGDLPSEKTQEYLDLIADGLARVEETVKKFLSFTPRRVEPRRTDLADVAAKAVALARHRIERPGTVLVVDLPPPQHALVFGDPHELQQVALNLLLNAGDAAAEAEAGVVRLRVSPGTDEVALTVEDNGPGLSPEDQYRCFDLFFTTKEVGEGSGLGLAVAHTIVTNHGGRIEVESAEGSGAVFRVVLPAEGNGAEAEAIRDEGP